MLMELRLKMVYYQQWSVQELLTASSLATQVS